MEDVRVETSTGPLARAAAPAAALVGLLSLVYAVCYLFVTPAAQRGSNADAFFRSYLVHPTGLRVASICLFLSGVLTTMGYAALHARPGALGWSMRTWALVLGTVAGVATSVHGLTDLFEVDRTAHRYASGDAATRAAVLVVHGATSPVDPRGLATFGLAGLVVYAFARHLRERNRLLGQLGQAYAIDLMLLFLASLAGSSVAVLVTGLLAAVLLGPAWWFGVAAWLRRPG